MYESLRPPMSISRRLGGAALEDFLLARHLLIDRLLEEAIESGQVSQVLEIAAGLSPRGWRFARRYGDRITYLESDLPEMAERKRRALGRAGTLGPRHRVLVLDALSESGERSLEAVTGALDPGEGLAIVTEGLLTYLPRESVLDLWRRSAGALSRFPHGLMLADVHLGSENRGLAIAVGAVLLSAFVRGRVSMHFEDEREAVAVLRDSGFQEAALRSGSEVSEARAARSIRVIEASRDAAAHST
jgi:O-methyltransferase involved in polyketide biosynthesis